MFLRGLFSKGNDNPQVRIPQNLAHIPLAVQNVEKKNSIL